MNPERWDQIKQIYHSALELEPGRRDEFLKEACAGDSSLLKEVTSLLAQDGNPDGLFESPALETVAQAFGEDKAQEGPDLVGRTLLHYHIEEKIGQGGMGEVYRARDTRLDRTVALKILPSAFASSPDRMRRFIREAKAASALSHPNVATVHEVGETEGEHFIVMEYVNGQTLSEYSRKRTLDPGQIIDIAIPMADALDEAHGKGIIHRDLKPANVMVTARGQVKVLDFGLAKLVKPAGGPGESSSSSLTESGLVIGTAASMSPEQVLGHALDQRTDIFSLGTILYELAAGHSPFAGGTTTEIMDRVLHTQPDGITRFNPKVPPELERIVRKCLEKDRERRYQSARDLLIDLQNLKRDLDSSRQAVAGPPGATVRGKLWWAGVLAAVAVAVTALGIAGWLWLGRTYPMQEEVQLTPVPLTSYRGTEDSPSFSPDGTQVAFQWCQEGQNCHIYVKQVGVEPPSQLTNAPMNDGSPAWSPDGRFIAFIREPKPKKQALMLIPQRGGSDRQLAAWDLISGIPDGPYLDWTLDSKWLAFPIEEGKQQNGGLFLISVDTGEKRRLTTAPAGASCDTAPSFSPDGRTLAFIRNTRTGSDLYLLRLGEGYRPKGEPERMVTGHRWDRSPAWTPDGREIVFSSAISPDRGLWRMEVSKPGKPARLSFASSDASTPAVSKTGNRLAYSLGRRDSNIWRADLERTSRKPRGPVQLISSTKEEDSPEYSPDGKRIAYVSNQSGAPEVWICDSDGQNPVTVTSFGGPWLHGLRWSPDGRSIAFFGVVAGNWSGYAVSADGGSPRRLTNEPGGIPWPFWSRDGQWLYFRSDRTGQQQIWKMPSKGGEATQVTRIKEAPDVPQESPDGRFLYYCRGWPFAQSVWKIPVGGGEETKVLDSVHPNALWSVRQEGIYYFTAPDAKGATDLCLLEFVSGKIRKILQVERNLDDGGNVAVSPDGRTVLYTQIDEAGSDLVLVENFR